MRSMFDAHLDLALNALYFNRDLLASIADVRESERGMTDELARGRGTVTLPELRRCRVAPARRGRAGYPGREEWQTAPEATPLGMILSMEGADPIVNPDRVERWWSEGLRAVGTAHGGRGQYAYGTASNGPLGERGVALLREFMRVGMLLDVTHLSDQSFFEAMDIFEGPMLASHQNCRVLVPGDRQFSDEQINILIQRGVVIGTAFDAWMLYPGWKRGETSPEVVGIEAAADHIDHICQLAGNARHCALGTDLDGRFGTEQTPRDLDTITDEHALEDILARRGYSAADIDGIFCGNWLGFFARALPA